MLLPKNGKMRTSEKPVKSYILRKVLTRAIQKCTFYQIWVILSKFMAMHLSEILAFLLQALTKYD